MRAAADNGVLTLEESKKIERGLSAAPWVKEPVNMPFDHSAVRTIVAASTL